MQVDQKVLYNAEDSAANISYKDVKFSELSDRIKLSNNVFAWEGLIINAYVQRGSEYYNYQDSLKISEEPLQNQIEISTSHDTNGIFIYNNLTADKILDVDKNKFDPNKLCKVYIAIYNGKAYITKVDGMITDNELAMKEQAKKEKAKLDLAKIQNPDSLNRNEYKEIKVEDFSFNMASGKLPVGSKWCFVDNFMGKPTDNSYKFNNISLLIKMKSKHNFVSVIPERCFTGVWLGNYVPTMTTVKVYITVIESGKIGECSVDIIEW